MASRSWTSDPATWPPPAERDREHWLIERGLREELLRSSPAQRDDVYRDVYNRLFDQVPWHEGNQRAEDVENAYEDLWFRLYGPLTRPGDTLVDLGSGRGSLIRRFAPAVTACVGIDASDAMVELSRRTAPTNAEFVVGSIVEPPLPPGSADMVISRQVMEHLHPDDAARHLAAVHGLLRPGGRFLIETPSRLTGPWDISRSFSSEATGFHLREYTVGELSTMLRTAGFRRVRSPAVPSRVLMRLGPLRSHAYVPGGAKGALEKVLARFPRAARRKVAPALVLRGVLVVGQR
jgi:SAM-dependent methyltransferase